MEDSFDHSPTSANIVVAVIVSLLYLFLAGKTQEDPVRKKMKSLPHDHEVGGAFLRPI